MNTQNKTILLTLTILLLLTTISTTTAAEHTIDNTNYDTYFTATGTTSTIQNEDTIILNDNFQDKNIIIDKNITLTSNTGKKITGTSSIKLTGDATGSTIRNIDITTTQCAINIEDVDNIQLISNNITVNDYTNAIWACSVENLTITNNQITITNNDASSYIYGITSSSAKLGSWSEIGDSEPANINVSNNIITVTGAGYGAGMQLDGTINGTINNNTVTVNAGTFAYGIISQWDWNMLDDYIGYPQNVTISNNKVNATAPMVYLIESYMGEYNKIINNTLTGTGQAVIAYGAAAGHDEEVTGNTITIYGNDTTNISGNADALGTHHAAIYYGESSSVDNLVENNTINYYYNGTLNSDTAPILLTGSAEEPTGNNTYYIDNDNFDTYFNSTGLTSTVTNGSYLVLNDNFIGKNMIVDKAINLLGVAGKTITGTSKITLNHGSDGTLIKGLTLQTTGNAIYVNNTDNNTILDNKISVSTSVGDNAIYVFSGNNNQILNNIITVTGAGYNYGINILSGSSDSSYGLSPNNNLIKGNSINVFSDNYGAGIQLDNNLNTIISDNNIFVNAENFAYGIVSQYNSWSVSGGAVSPENITISGNTINAQASIIYLVENFQGKKTILNNNILIGTGDAVYGYAALGASNDVIKGNTILVTGTDASNISLSNYDAIGTGHGGIYYKESSANNTIADNVVISTYKAGGDYAVKLDNTTNTIVSKNNLISDNNNKQGNEAVKTSGASTISDNRPNKVVTSISLSVGTINKYHKVSVKATVKDSTGRVLRNAPVIVSINGQTYNKITDHNGQISFTVSGLTKNSYSLSVKYAGDTYYKASSKTTTAYKKADLTISTVKRSGNTYKILVKNIGSKASTSVKLRVYYKKGKKTYSKTVTVKSIGIGKSRLVYVKFYRYSIHKRYTKYAYVNYGNKMPESSFKNNAKKFKV